MNLEKRIEALELFQTSFNSHMNKSFTQLSKEDIDLRINMYDEEAEEFLKSYRMGDKVETLDAICDEIFLTIGDAVSFGVQDKLIIDVPKYLFFNSPKKLTLMGLDESDDLMVNVERVVTQSCVNRLNLLVAKAYVLYGSNWSDILNEGMEAVEGSNMSKLGSDGKPIYNKKGDKYYDSSKPEGKILKNPHTYYSPTSKLKEILEKYGV